LKASCSSGSAPTLDGIASSALAAFEFSALKMPFETYLLRHNAIVYNRIPYYAYVEHDTGEQELYHLDTDPYELQSLHASPEHQALIDELHARLKALKTCAGNSCRTADGP
jgi:hypothetical protein